MLLGQANEPLLRSVLKTGVSQKKQLLMKLTVEPLMRYNITNLLDHIYKRNGNSSAVTNIIFQMTAQWVPKATNILLLILFHIDTLHSVLWLTCCRILTNASF